MEIDLNYKLKTLQQRLEQEQTEHKVTRAQLTDKYESIEEAKSAAMTGMPSLCQNMPFLSLLECFFKEILFFCIYFFDLLLLWCDDFTLVNSTDLSLMQCCSFSTKKKSFVSCCGYF